MRSPVNLNLENKTILRIYPAVSRVHERYSHSTHTKPRTSTHTHTVNTQTRTRTHAQVKNTSPPRASLKASSLSTVQLEEPSPTLAWLPEDLSVTASGAVAVPLAVCQRAAETQTQEAALALREERHTAANICPERPPPALCEGPVSPSSVNQTSRGR